MRALLSLDYNEMLEIQLSVAHAIYLITSNVEPDGDGETMLVGQTVETLRRTVAVIESALNLARIETARNHYKAIAEENV